MNFERFFAEQIREQKKAGSGAFHRRGKGVKHGMNSAFRTPYYFMTNKEKKKLNGEVEVSNMYDTVILPYKEFKEKNIEQQISLLKRWRENFDNKEIQEKMGIKNSPYYKLIKELGLTGEYTRKKGEASKKETTNQKIARKAKAVQSTIKAHREPVQEELTLMNTITPEVAPEPNITVFNGLSLEYNGEYTAEQLIKLFTKLQLLADGEDNKFKLALRMVEMG
jgi:hypothetical protein